MIGFVKVYIVETVLSLVVMGWGSHVVAIHVAQVFVSMLYTRHFVALKHDGCRLA